MNTPKVKITETDISTSVSEIPSGISGVMVKTQGGPIGATDVLITTWEQFKRLYGGFIPNSTDPSILLVKRALEAGSALRISRLVHYTDPSDAASYDAEFSTQGQTNIFTLSGNLASGHNISYTIGATSVNQDFDTSSLNTLNLLAAKIKAAFGNINDVRVISAVKFIVVPEGANITTDVGATTGVGAPSVTRTSSTAFKSSAGDTLFTIAPKYPGVYYNNLKLYVNPASNGVTGYWDFIVEHLADSSQTETYKNILIPGSPTVANSHYLDEVVKKSKLVNVTYSDLSAIVSTPISPVVFTIKMNAGSDGTSLADADYIGDSSAKTGLYAFDGIDDIPQFAILNDPENLSSAVIIAAAAYANTRKDLQYFAYVAGESESALISTKDAFGIDSSYVMFFGGLIKVLDPSDSREKNIPAIGDILGLAASADFTYGLWYSFAGYNRGVIQNSLGAVNQWGSNGNQTNLDLLANHQINVVINRSRRTMLWGCFTGQLATSQLSLANVRRLHLFLKKSIGPVLEQFLEEPNDIPTWKIIYITVKPLLDSLKTRRAMYDYRWEGDQFARSLDDLVINNSADVALGKYKVRLFVKDIPAMQEFSIDITITPAGISFEDALIIVNPNS